MMFDKTFEGWELVRETSTGVREMAFNLSTSMLTAISIQLSVSESKILWPPDRVLQTKANQLKRGNLFYNQTAFEYKNYSTGKMLKPKHSVEA